MADFEKLRTEFSAQEIDLYAASVDDLADAQKMIAAEHLTFPVAHGLDALVIARTLGSFYNDTAGDEFLQPTDFIIRPDGMVETATYSSAAIGRLSAADALALIGSRKQRAAKT